MKTIVIITSNELRHEFLRKYLASHSGIRVLKSYCEVPPQDDLNSIGFRNQHLQMRAQTEIDFFGLFCETITDNSNPEYIPKGTINLEVRVAEIIDLNPDLIISFGCSIIKGPLINHFNGRFINLHLGLSPYYRGSGTNFFPFVNNEPQYTGVTFMYIDKGIDTGRIIHQIRAHIVAGDNIHQIGNRLIKDMAKVTLEIILKFDGLLQMQMLEFDKANEKYYRKSDFTDEALQRMYLNFCDGMIEDYLQNYSKCIEAVPIITNKALENHA